MARSSSIIPSLSLLYSIFLLVLTDPSHVQSNNNVWPIVLNTWAFKEASENAWSVLQQNGSSLDAVEKGCTRCEQLQCDGTVGYGGSPDENGETTLDAMIMDGTTHKAGAVGALRRVKSAISVARYVMEYTDHTMLVGDQATQFAVSMGFPEETLTTNTSKQKWVTWRENSCQPNYWQNVSPNPKEKCGPYHPKISTKALHYLRRKNKENNEPRRILGHDTIGMVAIDTEGRVAAGTSTNGLIHKIAGRVGDSPIIGSGAYCDKDVGAAAGTGDGDVMMRFLPSYQAVENMRNGMSPSKAANEALKRMTAYHVDFSGAVIALNMKGEHGAACHGMKQFPYIVSSKTYPNTTTIYVQCIP